MYIIPDILWKEIEELIPKKKSKVGRPEKCAKKALNGILYILKTGAHWHLIPKEFGKPTTLHGKFRKWVKLGVFEKIMEKARAMYSKDNNNSWYAIDSSSSKAPLARKWSGKNPTDRGKRGVKKSIIVDRKGAPIAISVAPANVHDSKIFNDTFNLNFCTTTHVKILAADSAYDSKKIKNLCKEKNFILLAAENKRRKNTDKKPYKPLHRWIVERTFAWLHQYRSIKTCWAKAKSSYLAFCLFAASIQLFKMKGIFV